jgi:nucleotide-binding universal stress UspA family protein
VIAQPDVQPSGCIVDEMVRATETAHRDRLNTLVEGHNVGELDTSIHIVSGEPSGLLRLANHLDMGLIVLDTADRTGLRDLITSSTAESILRSVRCSVSTVEPEGFTTPIEPRRESP